MKDFSSVIIYIFSFIHISSLTEFPPNVMYLCVKFFIDPSQFSATKYVKIKNDLWARNVLNVWENFSEILQLKLIHIINTNIS